MALKMYNYKEYIVNYLWEFEKGMVDNNLVAHR
jgi:hypothetical protein